MVRFEETAVEPGKGKKIMSSTPLGREHRDRDLAAVECIYPTLYQFLGLLTLDIDCESGSSGRFGVFHDKISSCGSSNRRKGFNSRLLPKPH
jgi:hypothetical protein